MATTAAFDKQVAIMNAGQGVRADMGNHPAHIHDHPMQIVKLNKDALINGTYITNFWQV